MVGCSTHWLTGLWLLAITGLAAVVVVELAGGVVIAPDVTAAAPANPLPEAPPEPGEFQPPPQRQFNEISVRPLFFPSRRPFVPPATAAGAQAAATETPQTGLELIGVMLTERERAALLQAEGQGGAHWVHEQQTVAGWLVEEIAADRVQLRAGDRVEVVKLRADQLRAASPAKRKRKQTARKIATAGAAEPAPEAGDAPAAAAGQQ